MDINELMKQAQAMQAKMQDMQTDMEKEEVMGKSGGDVVRIIMAGTGRVKNLHIDEALFKEESPEIIQDLLIAAFNDAKDKCDRMVQEKSASALGNISLPPGFKMPF